MKVKLGIASQEAIKERTLAIARGELKPRKSDPKIWATSLESVAQILNKDNQALLSEIYRSKPKSLKELAELTGRHTSNLSRTLKTMENYKLVTLQKENGRLRPQTNVTGIKLDLDWERAS